MKLRTQIYGVLIALYFLLVLLLLMGPYILADDGADDPPPAPANVHTMPTPSPIDDL